MFFKISDCDDDLLSECKVETFRSSGKGGQHANKTNSAVRITHIKSGIKAICQSERSQFLNKKKCLKEIRLRINKNNVIPVKRIKTNPSQITIEKRLKMKKYNSEKKKNRQKLKFNLFD